MIKFKLKSSVILMVLIISKNALAAEESLDLAFLEWLGETAEIEELGIDIDTLLQQLENNKEQKSEESSQ